MTEVKSGLQERRPVQCRDGDSLLREYYFTTSANEHIQQGYKIAEQLQLFVRCLLVVLAYC